MDCFASHSKEGGWAGHPTETARCGTLLRSLSADARSSDDVIIFEGPSMNKR